MAGIFLFCWKISAPIEELLENFLLFNFVIILRLNHVHRAVSAFSQGLEFGNRMKKFNKSMILKILTFFRLAQCVYDKEITSYMFIQGFVIESLLLSLIIIHELFQTIKIENAVW